MAFRKSIVVIVLLALVNYCGANGGESDEVSHASMQRAY